MKNFHVGKVCLTYIQSLGVECKVCLSHAGGSKVTKPIFSNSIKRYNGGANWGSPSRKIRTIITNERNKVVLPENYHLFHPNGYTLEGYRSTSPEIVFRLASVSPAHDPITKVLKIWFVEDLFDYSQKDNSGETCADVFVLYP